MSNKYLEKIAEQANGHDWKPAATQAGADMVGGAAIAGAGGYLGKKLFKGKILPTTLAIGGLEGAASFAMADHLQRKREKMD
ncbi:MAG TPA: hypothetical protein VFM18_00490 [Methanosarcina sp.]|nr:hypothetical protein [Methanosarcina sp.]